MKLACYFYISQNKWGIPSPRAPETKKHFLSHCIFTHAITEAIVAEGEVSLSIGQLVATAGQEM